MRAFPLDSLCKFSLQKQIIRIELRIAESECYLEDIF